MITISEMRQAVPGLGNLPDGEFVRTIHQKLYSEIPYKDFLRNVDFREKSTDPTEGMSGIDTARAGAGKFFYDVGRGVSQRLGDRTPQQVDEQEAIDAPLMKTTGGKVGYGGAAIASTLPLMFAPGANTAAGSAAYGALTGGVMPTGANESAGINAALGAGMGVGGHAVGRLISGAPMLTNTNNPARQNLVDLATQKYNIDIPASTRAGSKPLAYAESQIAQLPGGGAMQSALQRPHEQLAERIMQQAGGAGLATTSGLQAAKQSTQKGYQNIWRGQDVAVDGQLATELDAAWKAAKKTLSRADQRIVRAQIDNIWDKVQPLKKGSPQLVIDGDVYQTALRGDIAKAMPESGPLMNILKDVRKAIDGAANRSIGPSSSLALKDLNREYAIQKAIAPLIPAAEARGGTFTPSGLLGPLGQFSGDVGELARIGPLLREPPNSGTISRGLISAGVLGLPSVATGSVVPAAAGLLANFGASRALSNPVVQKYLANGFGSLTRAEQELIGNLIKSGALSTAVTANAGQQ